MNELKVQLLEFYSLILLAIMVNYREICVMNKCLLGVITEIRFLKQNFLMRNSIK